MVLYEVYLAFFQTLAGTFRSYIGYTGNAEKREDKLGLGGVGWTKCLKKGTLKLKVLVPGLDSKAVALALEAWHAAKAIRRDPQHVRGGPWLSVRALKADDLYEVQAAAGCSSADELGPLAELLGPTSRLYQHLKNLKFGPRTKQASSSSSSSSGSSSSSNSQATTTMSAKAKARPKATTKAKPLKGKASDKAKVKAKIGPKPLKKLKLYIRAKRSGTATGESGSQFRVRKGLEGKEFVTHKLGKKPVAAKKRHWQNYAPMRKVRKRPSAK
jgi:hypothetical protein